MTLHFQKFGETGSPIILIHGLFGSGANWRSVARELSEDHIVYLLDLRNHGASPHFPSHTYVELASDIQELVISEGLQDYILCGHSMGGKAVMVNALMSDMFVDNQLRGIVIYDIAPIPYEHSHSDNLAALMALDLSAIESRADADKKLKASIPDNATRLFLLQSLAKDGNMFYWKLNLPVLKDYMADIIGFPTGLVVDKQCIIPALFLYGGNSSFVKNDYHQVINQFFPNARLEKLENASHWVHIDERDKLIKSTKQFIQKQFI